jgi:epoxyqueuosine reductase QueG
MDDCDGLPVEVKQVTLEGSGVAAREHALSLGAELYGVASAEAHGERRPDKPQPERFVENAQSAIVIGLPFEPGTRATVLSPELAALRTRASDEVSTGGARPGGAKRSFIDEENGMIVREPSMMGYRIARYLRRHGWRSLHPPACKPDPRFGTAPLYRMLAMHLGGMGMLGLNLSTITPEFGPGVFVTSIITDWPLPPGQPRSGGLCTDCGLCVANCPIQGPDDDGGKNHFACASYGCCGTCIAISPKGGA